MLKKRSPQPILYVYAGVRVVIKTTARHPDTNFSHTLSNRFRTYTLV